MISIDLSGDWRLIRASTGEDLPAKVPGDTHSALLEAGKIPDPYAGTNELEVQWVGREDWEYQRTFSVPPELLKERMVYLRCEGLDTIAEILLNGKRAGRADNAFLRWIFDVHELLKPGENSIQIRFTSAEKAAEEAARKLPYPIPHTVHPVQSPHRNLVRKTQCHAGWDWGPCLMVAGIQGNISVQATSDVRIDYVYTEQTHGANRCRVRVFVECTAARAGGYDLALALGETAARGKVSLREGPNRIVRDIAVSEPRLWWPNGYGQQPLYDLTVEVGGDAAAKKIGLRTLELVNKKDRWGVSMLFRVNGVDIFCKGANWIPSDALPQRQTAERIAHLLSSAAQASMNMLRVWGGGQYESETFYSLCDAKGILVWQDMMFACALYPATPRFLAGVDREVRHQVKRLRDHTCIALWCGNNENLGSLSWFPESKRNRDRYLVDYDRLYEGVIGKAVDECDPTRAFWPSSPSGGRGMYSDNWHDDTSGDMHYWSVWHEGKPFSAYSTVTPRFCSEFGFQSFPAIEVIRTFADERSLNVTSPVMEHHQRHPGGNSHIIEMISRYFRIPDGFESFVYLSQVQQAIAIKTAVEFWRSRRPICMGTLFWQLNDNWPVCSWSSIDYGGKWKLLHHAARRFFAPVLITAVRDRDAVEVWMVNDGREETRGTATVSVIDFQGKHARDEEIHAVVPAGAARLLKSYEIGNLAPAQEKHFVSLAFKSGNGTLFNEFFFTEYKRCDLTLANLTIDVSEADGGFSVRLATDKPAFFVSVEAHGIAGEFSDNCFCMMEETPRTLLFIPRRKVSLAHFRDRLHVRHLRDSYR